MTYHIKDALKKQFDLLSEASEGCVDGDELSSLTHAMLQVCEFLERIERDEATQCRGIREHGVPEAMAVDDGEELRPCWHGGPLNGRGKAFERLVLDLKAAGAPDEFFEGKCHQEVLRDIADVLQIEKLANEAAQMISGIAADRSKRGADA